MTARIFRTVALLSLLAVAQACSKPEPDPAPPPPESPGELGVVFESAGGPQTSRDGEYEFGSVLAGHSRTKTIVVKNLSATGSLTLASLAPVNGEPLPQFAWTFSPTKLGPGESLEIPVTFSPGEGEPAELSMNLWLVASGVPPDEGLATITLRGSRSLEACPLPGTLDFLAVKLGDTTSQHFTVTNLTDGEVVYTIVGPSPFDGPFSLAPESSRILELEPGASFVLVNDHDPKPLYYQLEAEHPRQFSWTYLERGPEAWRVEIGRLTQAA